jgi:hypothetical protein
VHRDAGTPGSDTVRRKWATLSWRERRLLAQSVVLLPSTVVGLRLTGYDRTRRVVHRLMGRGRRAPVPPRGEAEERIAETVRMVAVAAARVPLGSACLAQSLTLSTLLARQGIDSEVVIAVRPGGAPLDAHAWVEHRGEPLNETKEVVATYARLRRGDPA